MCLGTFSQNIYSTGHKFPQQKNTSRFHLQCPARYLNFQRFSNRIFLIGIFYISTKNGIM